MRTIALSTLLILSLVSVCFNASAVPVELKQYDQQQTVSGFTRNKEITSQLKKMLGSKYSEFINNFDVYGEPYYTEDGGLVIQGWLQDLYLENASVVIIYPDAKIFAAWVVPDGKRIFYTTNCPEKNIKEDIRLWAGRFKGLSFVAPVVLAGDNRDVDYFETTKFRIKVLTNSNDNDYNEAVYFGVRKKDGAGLTLKGTATRKICENQPCPIISYKFRSGSTIYMLSKVDDSITVIQNNKIILNDKGTWTK